MVKPRLWHRIGGDLRSNGGVVVHRPVSSSGGILVPRGPWTKSGPGSVLQSEEQSWRMASRSAWGRRAGASLAKLGKWGDLSRVACEAIAIEGYRSGALSQSQVQRLLGQH